LGLVAFTDPSGQFTINLPAGTYDLVASYIGLDNNKASVTVGAGQRATRNFDLTTAIYQLDTFKVTGEREGNAAALTAQRNATNLKNVVAIDAYGNLPNMNASELAVLLPGVAPELSDEGNIVGFTIRGQGPGSNTITIDGALMASQGGAGRNTRMHTITGSMFESLELTKGHTPDKGADSLAGTLNLKSRSPLSMKEKRRITYNLSARTAATFTHQIPMRDEHRTHPLLNVAYQEVFDVFGGERNLGVAVNLFYSEQALGYYRVTTDYQNTTTSPAFIWNYQTEDNYNNRKQSSVNAKFDYRLSAHTKISLNLIYNDAMERFRLRYLFRAYTGNQNQNTVPNATTAVIPGAFTDKVTQVRATAQSTVDITSQMSIFYHRQRHADLGAEQTFGPLELDYNAVVSLDHINGGGGDGGVLVNRLTNIGWTLDRSASEEYPRLTQTAGPDITNPASYRPNSYTFADTQNLHAIHELRGNARYKLPTSFSSYVKTGYRWREEKADNGAKSRRYNFLGTNSAQLPTDPTIRTDNEKSGLVIPAWNANAIARDRTPIDTALWSEDGYFREMTKYTGTRGVTETVHAGYLMTQGMIARTGFIAGVRVEETKDDSWGWVRARVASTAAQQTADPVGAAQRDYANTRRDISGSYTKAFPSVHLTHDIRPNLKARMSWTNSFGRPPLTNLMPNETVNETNRTLTINNPNLKPKLSETWDAALEYYFEPVGSFSVGWFHQTVRDYFINNQPAGTVGPGNDNGYNGEYAGFDILTSENLGTAIVQGWEISYLQQFTFLPGLLKGLSLSANYTYLETHGNFGGTTTLQTDQVAGFIPRNGNISLSWRHHGFSARTNINYVGHYLDGFNAANPALNIYRGTRTIVNVGVAYQVRPAVSLSIDVANIFNESQSFYRGYFTRLQSRIIPGSAVTFGVSGRF
jgi:TonB-dependent receptor